MRALNLLRVEEEGSTARRQGKSLLSEASLDFKRLIDEVRTLRILLAWSCGAMTAGDAESALGVKKGDLWGLEKAQIEEMKQEAVVLVKRQGRKG